MSEEEPKTAESEGEAAETAESAPQAGERLSQDISALSAFAERLRIREYVMLLQRPWRLVWVYFITGVARGAGVIIGTILILALLTYLLSTIVNVPMVGKYLAGLVQEVQRHLPGK